MNGFGEVIMIIIINIIIIFTILNAPEGTPT